MFDHECVCVCSRGNFIRDAVGKHRKTVPTQSVLMVSYGMAVTTERCCMLQCQQTKQWVLLYM